PLQEPVEVFTGIVPLAIRTGATSVAALAGLGTLLVAGGLARRQRRAWWIALTLLTIGGLSHVVRDLDVPEAVLNLTLAFVLLSYRREFDARTGPGTIRRAILALPALLLVVWGFGVLAIVSHANGIQPHPSVADAMAASFRGLVGLRMNLTVAGETGRWIPGLLPILSV